MLKVIAIHLLWFVLFISKFLLPEGPHIEIVQRVYKYNVIKTKETLHCQLHAVRFHNHNNNAAIAAF